MIEHKVGRKNQFYGLVAAICTVLAIGYGMHLLQVHNDQVMLEQQKTAAANAEALRQCEAYYNQYIGLAIADSSNPGNTTLTL